MFANFLFFLIALVIYSTAKMAAPSPEPADHVFVYTALATLIFAAICKTAFSRLNKRAAALPEDYLDQNIQTCTTRLSILALIVFSLDLYCLNLPALFSGTALFRTFPTLEALFFLVFFIFHLIIVWASAWQVQKEKLPSRISQTVYIRSNLSISLPAVLPWFIISFFADLIQFLPWDSLKSFLLTPLGEMVYILVFLVPLALFAPMVIARFWGCRPLTPGPERACIENACKKAGVTYTDILEWNLFGGAMITAGVMGLIGRFRYILVTPAMIRALNFQEIEAVILHEIGHVQKKHMLFYLLFVLGFMGSIYFLVDPLILLLSLSRPLIQAGEIIGMEKKALISVVFNGLIIGWMVVYFRFLFGFFMRNFERQADIHLFSFTDHAWPLISTFQKIASISRQSPDKPSWHHFSIRERVSFLTECQLDPHKITRHHSRIKIWLSLYLIAMTGICYAGYTVNYGWARQPFETYVTKKILQQELALNPDRSDLYVMVADYYYGLDDYQRAKEAYENVLKIDPDNVHALNNLSWLLATCPDSRFVDAPRALELARKAVAIEPSPHILDTHAEACFINNDLTCAVEMARRAFDAAATEKKAYYRDQLARFKKAFDSSVL